MAEQQQQQAPKSARTVVVACKMPNGMILHLQEEYTDHEQTPNGVRDVKRHRKIGDGVFVAGCAMPVGVPNPPKKSIVGGYALTRGVDAEFWTKWLEQNKDAPYVRNGIIFAMPSRDAAEEKADEQEAIKSGLEPLDPTFTTAKDGTIVPADPRYPKQLSGVSAIHTGDRNS